jgi:LysR family nitrogen assimilation transcriptional regulator
VKPVLMRQMYLGYQASKPLSAASRAIGQLSWTLLEGMVRSGGWSATWNGQEHLHL